MRTTVIMVLAGILLTPVSVDSITPLSEPAVQRCWRADMLHLKPGVNPHNIQPEVNLLIQIVSSIYAKHGQDCIITSLYDDAPTRKVNSFHRRDGLCRAVDFKTVHLPETIKDIILGEAQEAIGYGNVAPRAFDFIFEPRITNPDGRIVKEQHFHGEFDSKFPVQMQPKDV